ncbi:NADPH-dependent F420 reductase [Gluconacetobacter sacchari]|uniref:NAD(P)-binding domain-containing protein n=2 Tax=Gluconacetobacter sacchari TaxID=92759 RepID=A0A7W4I9K7_9PROT|nr:NAD(P)-binding domain-containing protein [Gluconacetobacter sacchari]MBB2158765.1 NAD(P)-binding domain-containing protein [Gluconacetobacter sacchari]GBQ21954.1 hypothetical protein AA12717_1046 [Gluconacetobacter sacchari DSM 12717]
MRIAIIGAGHVGEALATTLARAGYEVAVANSRGRGSLTDFARRTGATACDLLDISAGADVLIVAIPFGRLPRIPAEVMTGLSSAAIVVDASNYYPLRDGHIAAVEAGQVESVWVARQLGRPVVKAFNNIIADRLPRQGRPPAGDGRIALPVAGDDPAARGVIMTIVDALGFDPYDAGAIEGSWRQQPGQPAYCTDPSLAELPGLLRRADRQAAIRNRDRGARLMAKLPADYPPDDLVRIARFFVGLDRSRPASWMAVFRLGVTLMRGRA